MLPSAVIFLFAVVGVTRSNAAVTNDDIRAAILQLVKVVKVVEDKLERHEYRDRVIGEQLKKGLINIDKRIKMLDPLKGTVSRLDERLAAVETILMQKNEREKMQLQRTYEAVIDIQKNLPVIIEDMKNDIISKIVMPEPPAQITEAVMTKKDFEKMEKEVATKMDKITNGVDKLGNELSKLQDANKNIKDLHNKSSDNLEKLKQHINDSQQVLTKYDKKLSEFSNKGTAPNHKEQEELKKNVLKVLDSQKSSVKDILQDIKNLHNQVKQLPQKGDVTNLQHTVTNKCNGSGDGALKQTLNKIIDNLNKSHNDAMKNINGLTELTATLMKSFANTNNVLDTQNSNVKEILRDVKYLQQHMNGSSSNSQAPITGDIQRDLNKIIENINSTHDDAMKNINGLTELTATMMKSFAYTNSDVKYILQDVQNLKQQINHLPHSDNVTNAQGTILNKLEHILNSSKSGLDTLNRIDENVNNGHQDTVKNINGLSEITATLLKSSANINNAIDAQKSEVEEILRGVTNIRNKIDQLPQRDDLLKAQQKTDRKVEETCTPNNNNNLSNDAGLSLEEIKNSLIRNDRDITRNLQNLTDLMKNTCGSSSKTSDAKEILNDLKYLQNQVNQLPQKHDIAENLNTTLQKLGQLSNEISYRSEKSVEDIRKTLRHINDNINKTHEDTAEKLNDLSEISVTLGESFVSNYDKIKAEIQGLNRLDQVLIKTADNVIDMKRRLEFGVLQIMSESNKNSKETVKNIQDALSDRLDSFEESILDDKNGALANVTSKLEEDIQQVWRQIGIMYQQMSSNSEVLKQLQNQTDAYVNGSIGAMNNVKGKVGQITGRITEVDENLNYLLGRLSLVTQEFGRIKTGLSSALDQIRQSFNAVQNKINEGPGPHNITSSEETVPAS